MPHTGSTSSIFRCASSSRSCCGIGLCQAASRCWSRRSSSSRFPRSPSSHSVPCSLIGRRRAVHLRNCRWPHDRRLSRILVCPTSSPCECRSSVARSLPARYQDVRSLRGRSRWPDAARPVTHPLVEVNTPTRSADGQMLSFALPSFNRRPSVRHRPQARRARI